VLAHVFCPLQQLLLVLVLVLASTVVLVVLVPVLVHCMSVTA
jgi:hypothetical protein